MRLTGVMENDRILTLIRLGLSVPEIRLDLGEPKWEPTEEQRELMKLAKEARMEALIRDGASRQRAEQIVYGESILEHTRNGNDSDKTIRQSWSLHGKQAHDRKLIDRISLKPGCYEVPMEDGHIHKMVVLDVGVIEPSQVNTDDTRKNKEKKDSAPKKLASVVPLDSFVCIDGSNVISLDDKLRIDLLKAILKAFDAAGYKYKVFVDKSIFSWLRNKKNDNEGADYLSVGEKQGFVIVAPNKVEADGQILQLAEFEQNVHIITNDRYRDYAEMHPWLKDRWADNRLHGINLVPMGNGTARVLIAGFNLDITVS